VGHRTVPPQPERQGGRGGRGRGPRAADRRHVRCGRCSGCGSSGAWRGPGGAALTAAGAGSGWRPLELCCEWGRGAAATWAEPACRGCQAWPRPPLGCLSHSVHLARACASYIPALWPRHVSIFVFAQHVVPMPTEQTILSGSTQAECHRGSIDSDQQRRSERAGCFQLGAAPPRDVVVRARGRPEEPLARRQARPRPPEGVAAGV